MWIVTIGAASHYAPALPSVESLAMRSTGPRFSLGEMALRAKSISVIQRRALSAFQGEQLYIVR